MTTPKIQTQVQLPASLVNALSVPAVATVEPIPTTPMTTVDASMANQIMKGRIAMLVKEGKTQTEILGILNGEGFKSNRGGPLSASALAYYLRGAIVTKGKPGKKPQPKLPQAAKPVQTAAPALKPAFPQTSDAMLRQATQLVLKSPLADADKLMIISQLAQ